MAIYNSVYTSEQIDDAITKINTVGIVANDVVANSSITISNDTVVCVDNSISAATFNFTVPDDTLYHKWVVIFNTKSNPDITISMSDGGTVLFPNSLVFSAYKKYVLTIEGKKSLYTSYCHEYSLPYDAELDYIEVSGTQWVDTGLTVNVRNLEFEFTVTNSTISGEAAVVGNDTGISDGPITEVYFTQSTVGYYIKSGVSKSASVTSSNATFNIKAGTTENEIYLYVNGAQYIGEVAIPEKLRKIYLFKHGGGTFYKGKISCFLIKYNGTTLRNYIPVRVNNTGYLYDKIEGKLYESESGQFILGSDI